MKTFTLLTAELLDLRARRMAPTVQLFAYLEDCCSCSCCCCCPTFGC